MSDESNSCGVGGDREVLAAKYRVDLAEAGQLLVAAYSAALAEDLDLAPRQATLLCDRAASRGWRRQVLDLMFRGLLTNLLAWWSNE